MIRGTLRFWSACWMLFAFLLTGCASFTGRSAVPLERSGPCQQFLTDLDETVAQAGVRDASSSPVPGFPYLRTTRFLVALKKGLKTEDQRELWLRWMQQLDLQARQKEIRNLPEPFPGERTEADRARWMEKVTSCSEEMFLHDRQRPGFFTSLEPRVEVPDEYSLLMRIAGLYPLVVLPVAVVTDHSRKSIRAWYETPYSELPVDGHLRTYAPAEQGFLSEEEIEKILETSKENALRVPQPEEDQVKRLVSSFAPVFIQDVAGPYDLIGQPMWSGDRLGIDTEKPLAYYYLSHAFLKGESILQINYVIWFSQRTGERPPWIEKGNIDGLTVRVSLGRRGKPFLVDVINNCGCYHSFFPGKEEVDKVLSRSLQFDPFVSQWLCDIPSGRHLGIRLNSGWHQVQRLLPTEESPDAIRYILAPYEDLESLPRQDHQRASMFDDRGIVKGSKRPERFILFSMGIPEIGSMRQRGHHAIELIGREHFDDPALFDRSFVFR